MRKVLLATTALVAMSVTAAQADVSVGGTAVFEIYSPGTGAQTFTSDGSVVIKGSTTTDTGLTFTAVQDAKFEGAATVNDAYVEVSGDFGTLRAGQTDGASTVWTALLLPTWILKAQVIWVIPTSPQQPLVPTLRTSACTSHQ
jgi:hypothetical protein